MSTVIRPEVSEKNKYWISKHRYYELKHFCMQYGEWKEGLKAIDIYPSLNIGADYITISQVAIPVERCAELRERYLANMALVEKTAREADIELWEFMVIGVTEGVSYDYLYSRLEIPCSKDTYYDRYRKFFWLLDKARN